MTPEPSPARLFGRPVCFSTPGTELSYYEVVAPGAVRAVEMGCVSITNRLGTAGERRLETAITEGHPAHGFPPSVAVD